jgi:tol-pal system protein YbgF
MLVAVLLFGGCAGLTELTGTATQQDVTALRADLTALGASMRQLQRRIDDLPPQLEDRLRLQTIEQERHVAGVRDRVEALGRTVAALSARLDEVSVRLEALTNEVRRTALPAAPTGPVSPAPGAQAPVAQAPRPTPPPPTPAGALPVGSRPHTGAPQPQDLYQAAYIDFSRGNYPLAVSEFTEFLRQYPEHPLAANAQYWIGEAYLAVARGHADRGERDQAEAALGQAVREFRKVLANYPRSDKAPAALYKEALALLDLQQPAQAQARLQYLVETFPQSEEALLARERLAASRER